MAEIPVGYCQCGCGQRTSVITIPNKKKGRIKGEFNKYINGHNGRGKPFPEMAKKQISIRNSGKIRSLETRILLSKNFTGKDPIFSPFVPNAIVIYDKKRNRWHAHPGDSRWLPHSRLVWEYFNGSIPSNRVVHHKNGQHNKLEDDRIDNLMLLPRWWNSFGLPRLERKYKLDTLVVTEAYLKWVNHCESDELYRAIDEELERIIGVSKYE